MTIIIGIDPGQTGSLAIIKDGQVVELHDMPVSQRLHGTGQQVNAAELASILLGRSDATVYLEAVHAMPGQGISSTFRFGESLGVVLGVCGALQLPIRWQSPTQWKKAAGLTKKEKDAARTLAMQLHPEVADMLSLKKHVGRADAILIAEFGQ